MDQGNIKLENLGKDIGDLVNQLNDETIKKITKDVNIAKKKELKPKKTCPCAVKASTLKDAQDRIKKGRTVLVEKIEKNGKISNNFYTECTRTAYEGDDLCFKHMQSLINNPSLVSYWEEKKKICQKVNLDDEVFVKKNSKKNKKDLPDEINYVLENEKLYNLLIDFCKKIIKNDSKSKKSQSCLNKQKSSKKSEIKDAEIDSSDISENEEVESNNEEVESNNEEVESNNEELQLNIDDNKSIKDKSDSSAKECDNLSDNLSDNDSNHTDESDDSNQVEVEEITTNSGTKLYYDKENNRILKPDGDEEGTELGNLIKCKKEICEVEYEDNYYIIGKIEQYNKNEYIICPLTMLAYNKELKKSNKIKSIEPLEIILKKKN